MKGQPKHWSFYEACINTAVGFGINLAVQIILYPQLGFHPSMGTQLFISTLFTVISVGRGYLMRRVFNWIHVTFFV